MDCLGMDLFPFVQNEIPGGVLMFTLFRCPFFFSEGLQIFGFSLPETDQVWHSSNHRIFVFWILAAQPFLVKKDVFLVILMF